MSRQVTVAATQFKLCGWNVDDNIAKAEKLVRDAASKGANIILLQELFETPYFCQNENPHYFSYAKPLEENAAVKRFQIVAAELNVVLPICFYERKNQAYYNTTAVIDADGMILGIYRKTHIPDGPGYEEKYYFNPGDTGFKVTKTLPQTKIQVWNTKFAKIGIAICWDQWFPESARCLVLQGAEIIFYPTAIGSEPTEPNYDSKDHWQRTMQGHSAANLVPVVTSNRTGLENIEGSEITFYGSSFITDHVGAKICEASRDEDNVVLTATFDLEKIHAFRRSWGVFRDRRPNTYAPLLTMDGVTQ